MDNSEFPTKLIDKVAQTQEFQCSECNYLAFSGQKIKTHYEEVHENSAEVTKIFECVKCHEDFSSEKQFLAHNDSNHGGFAAKKCDICESIVSNPKDLSQHMKQKHTSKEKRVLCEMCNRHFYDNSHLNSHINRVHHEIKKFQCNFCGKADKTKTEHNRHIKNKHMPKDIFECDKCDKTLTSKLGLNLHLERSHSAFSKSKQCEFCEKSYRLSSELDKHKAKIHGRKYVAKCSICDKEFNSESKLSIHVNEVHGQIKNHKCDICNKQFGRGSLLKKHVKVVHRSEEIEKEKCKKCNLVCMPENMKKHMKKHDKDENQEGFLNCEKCDEKFKFKSELDNHIHSKHNGFQCDVCNMVLKKKSLRAHVVTMHSSGEQKCEICEQTFENPSLLKNHQKEHLENEKQFYCEFCTKIFSSSEKRKKHIKLVHCDLPKLFKCQLCENSFINKIRLRNHVNEVHEKLKPFKCDFCNKMFGRKWVVETHKKIVHLKKEGIKIVKCGKCDMSFNSKTDLKRHVLRVHEKLKNEECNICKKTFFCITGVRIHKKEVHEKQKNFRCNHCEKSFSRNWLLKNHLKNVHKKGE